MPKGVRANSKKTADVIVAVGAKFLSDGSALPEGVSVRSEKAIQVDFYCDGKRCREKINELPTERAVKEAGVLRLAVVQAIARKQYVRDNFFQPNRKSEAIDKVTNKDNHKMPKLLQSWLDSKEGNIGLNSHDDYEKIIKSHLVPCFGHMNVGDVGLGVIIDFRKQLLDKNISVKRIRNIMIPLRGTMEQALACGFVINNPFDKLPPLSLKKIKERTHAKGEFEESFDDDLPGSDYFADQDSSNISPFTPTEQKAILDEMAGQEKNYFEFAFSSGLRTGELIALRWCDVDFQKKRIFVRQSLSGKYLKGPKTVAGIRWVDLDDGGWCPLLSQFEFTGPENKRVFHNPRTNKPWSGSARLRKRWKIFLDRAGVEYRRPYQTRHTYASTMLSRGENILKVAKQLGHKDWSMLVRVYGRWIPEVGNRVGSVEKD